MSETKQELPFTTGPIRADLADVLRRLKPGQKIRIKHLVRVGSQTWPVEVTGEFRELSSLATGIATHRMPEDDIIVPTVHFKKENKELSSVALDEHTKIEILEE